jgi:hypothetical protein
MKQWTERDTTARSGIVKLDRVVTDMGYIWRPTPNSDVGIDGEIELVEENWAIRRQTTPPGLSSFHLKPAHI